MTFDNLVDSLNRQKQFSDLFFDSENMSPRQKEEQTKTFALCMHGIVSDLVSSVNYKSHILNTNDVDHARILFKSVDIFRYTLALMNLWGIKPEDFVAACNSKDNFLHMRHELSKHKWCGQKVVIFDCDDVIASFKDHYTTWLQLDNGVVVNEHSTEYYNTQDIKDAGLEPEEVFREYINTHSLKELTVNFNVASAMCKLQNMGYWVQIVTARPSDNLNCLYDTFDWLDKNHIMFDDIAFTPEKYRWLMDQDFYRDDKLICVIDDSSKHAAEFAKHGVNVIVPAMKYNDDVSNINNIHRVDFSKMSSDDIIERILTL